MFNGLQCYLNVYIEHTMCKYKMFNMKLRWTICVSAATCQSLSVGDGDSLVRTPNSQSREHGCVFSKLRQISSNYVDSTVKISTWWSTSLPAVIAMMLNASQRGRVGVGMNRSAKG